MSGSDRPAQTVDDGVVSDVRPVCVALVPVVPTAQWSHGPIQQLPRPNSTFVTQLIATAEQAPQTRSLRRATTADAMIAYRASQHPLQCAGIRTRQII
jgi:hypothetical protein